MNVLGRYPALCLILVAVASPGCRDSDRARWEAFWSGRDAPTAVDQPDSAAPVNVQAVPPPLNLLLPKKIRIHPLTTVRTAKEAGSITVLDVRVEALDADGNTARAFGNFRFELFSFMPNSTEPKAGKLVTWEVPLSDPKTNLVHWNNINRAYEFKLQWDSGITAGRKYVLVAIFASPYTKRLFTERVFVTGQ